MKYYTAKTLKELKQVLDVAIEVAGNDSTWNGYDDGYIYIYPKDYNLKNDENWVCIANE